MCTLVDEKEFSIFSILIIFKWVSSQVYITLKDIPLWLSSLHLYLLKEQMTCVSFASKIHLIHSKLKL